MSNPMHAQQPLARACGAMTRKGEPCSNRPVTGATRCRMHGGRSPVGIASPHFRTGRHSKVLPAQLMARYQEAIRDPELLAMRDDLALVDVRIGELLGRVESGESGERWLALDKAWAAYSRVRGSGTTDEVKAWAAVDALIESAATDYAAWGEIMALIEQRRKVSESEHKRLVAMQQMVSIEDAMTLVAAVQEAVKRHVRDPVALQGIANDMRDLANRKRVYAA